MAKNNEDVEVFGEDFNILDGIEDIIPDDNDENSGTGDDENHDNDSGNDDEDGNGNDEGNGSDAEENHDDTNSSSSPLVPYAKYLKEEGILPNFDADKFDGSIDGLKEGMRLEIENGIEQYKSSIPEAIKNLLDNYEEGVPLETLLKIDSERFKYSSLTDENMASEDVQKQIIRDYFTATTRFSKEKIEKEISRFSDLRELEEEAKAALPELIEMQNNAEKEAIEAAKKQRADDEAARVREMELLKETLRKTNEIVPGMQVNDAMRDKVYKNLTTPVAYNEAGMPLNKLGAYRTKNPIQTEIILNYIFEVTGEFKDWSVFNKGTKRQVIADMENAARGLDNKSSGRAGVFQSESKKAFLREVDNFMIND